MHVVAPSTLGQFVSSDTSALAVLDLSRSGLDAAIRRKEALWRKRMVASRVHAPCAALRPGNDCRRWGGTHYPVGRTSSTARIFV